MGRKCKAVVDSRAQVFVANISDECIIGLDTMRMFKMILDVGKGMVGVNGKVLPGCFKYVGGAEVLLYPSVGAVVSHKNSSHS